MTKFDKYCIIETIVKDIKVVVMRDTMRNRAIFLFQLTISLILFCLCNSVVSAAVEGEVTNFSATGSEQVFTAPVKGYYV